MVGPMFNLTFMGDLDLLSRFSGESGWVDGVEE